ncbi:MAG: hypothetical protein WEB05_02255 [Solirubrobacterales bacterium]
MRTGLMITLPIILAVFIGCGSDSEISSLEGTWVGSGSGYNAGVYEETTSKIVITEVQEDKDVFLGYKQTRTGGEPYGPRETIQGGIGPDGRISIADEDGYNFFEFSEDKLEGQYLEAGEKDATVKNYTLTRE